MHCDANHLCDAEGVSINHDAHLFCNAATIVGGIGLAALITGTVLYVTARRHARSSNTRAWMSTRIRVYRSVSEGVLRLPRRGDVTTGCAAA